MTENNKPTSARDYRSKKKPFVLQVSAALTVLMKPIQMSDAFFQNLIPMPAAGVKEKFDQMEKKLLLAQTEGDASGINQIFDEKEAGIDMLDYMRRYACAAVIDPVIVMEDDGNEDHIPVTELSRLELMKIFNADPSGKEPPVVLPERLEEFRRSEPDPADSVAHDGEDVREAPKFLDHGDREVITA